MMEFFVNAAACAGGLVFILLLPNDITGMNVVGQYLVLHKPIMIFFFGAGFAFNFIGAMAAEVVKPEKEGDDNV